uniref:RNase H type-1 domain-containing protein n=1 Tax=Cannabis sativa TaxID=3483 RepID=A0A803NRF1_CANSA
MKVEDVVAFVAKSLDQWLKIQGRGNILLLHPLHDGDDKEFWFKPDSSIKVNIDVTIFEADGIVTPESAQALGIKEVLSWIKRNQAMAIVIESDSLLVVNAI